MDAVSEYFLRSALWPALLFVLILFILGTVGNALIIYIYRHHFHKSTPWLFIYVLAILDILACVISMPLEVLILVTYTHFPSGALCKFSRYITFVLHGSSCVILMAIAFNRYEKVCRPTKQILNIRRAKKFCIGTVIFALITFIPCLVIYGEVKSLVMISSEGVQYFPLDLNVTALGLENSTRVGRFCTIPKSDAVTILAPLFYVFQFTIYVLLVVLVIYFYTRVISKMMRYSSQQRNLLLQMSSVVSRVDHVRGLPNKNNVDSPVKVEATADFSKDFCRNEVSVDLAEDRTQDQKDNVFQREHSDDVHYQDSAKYQISPPVIVMEDEDGNPVKPAGSENNIHLRSTKDTNNPLETNKLLMRRIQSTDNFNKMSVRIPQLQLVPSIDPYEALFEPIFLHAPKSHKKKNSDKSSTRKSKKDKSKSKPVTRSRSNVDISMRMVKRGNRDENGGVVSCRSLEGLSGLHCINPNESFKGTLTLARRSTKGCKNCVIPLTGLSMKSAMTYDSPDAAEETVDENAVADDVRDSGDEMKNHEEEQDYPREECCQNGETALERAKAKIGTVTFQEDEDQDPKYLSINRRGSKDVSPEGSSRNSENILTPETKRVDYRRRQSVQPIRAHRTSRMLFWISLAFVLSFLPFWIVVFLRLMNGNRFMARPSNITLAFVHVLVRFTHISNAINPVIYGFMNTQFRNRCSDIFKWNSK